MALFKFDCGGVEIVIFEVDHGPPHCHLFGLPAGRVTVNLLTLRVMKPRGYSIPPKVRRCLRDQQLNMLTAWEKVISFPEADE